jgi:hypothetical protein
MQKFGFSPMSGSQFTLADWAASRDGNIRLSFKDGGAPLLFGGRESSHSVEVLGWAQRSLLKGASDSTQFVPVEDHEATLAQMLLSHQGADFCLVGGKVC